MTPVCRVLGAMLAVVACVFSALPASAAAPPSAYGMPAYVYDAPARLSSSDTMATDARGSPSGPGATSWETSVSVAGDVDAANTGSEVLLDTSAVKAQSAAQSLMKPGECAVICSTVEREAARQGFSTAGLPVVADGTSAVLRSQVAQQLRGFGAAARGLENDATIGATALERGVPLITGDRALWNSVLKLGGDARWFAPGT